jgi:two-component system response regulator FixJ
MQPDTYVVHLLDDEEAVRKSLAFLLTTTGFTVRVHETAASFLAVAPQLTRACLVTDVRMPEMSGLEILKRLGDMGVTIPTVLITGHGDVPMAVAAMKAGAVDFIEKPFEDEVLIEAIRRAGRRLETSGRAGDDANELRMRLARLSERERQVLHGIVAGSPNKTIAYDLDISPRTVEVHRANLMSKMHARSLSELVRMAVALGIEDDGS